MCRSSVALMAGVAAFSTGIGAEAMPAANPGLALKAASPSVQVVRGDRGWSRGRCSGYGYHRSRRC
jgi:hypothetical protein